MSKLNYGTKRLIPEYSVQNAHCIQRCRRYFRFGGLSNKCMCKHAAARVVWGHAPTGKLDVQSVIVFKAILGQKKLLE